MTKLEELTKRIQEYIPGICKCEMTLGQGEEFTGSPYYCRNINLEDVLRVIDMQYDSRNKDSRWYAISDEGLFLERKLNSEWKDVEHIKNVGWELGKSLNDQDTETIEFLYNIIFKIK